MKPLKELTSSAAFAWSPLSSEPYLLVAGSVHGAMSEDFSSEANVGLYHCDLNGDTSSLQVLGAVSAEDRMSRLDWSPHARTRGIVAGALVEGIVCVWDTDAIAKSEDNALLCQIEAHSGLIRGLQFNPLQPSLLATSGQDKELRIWTLTDPSNALLSLDPTAQKNPHGSEVTDLKWNLKFAHILSCTTSGGQAHVWDLKAKRCTVTFQNQNKAPINCIAWHPDNATCVAVATDDPKPVIQTWDLRKAVAPTRTLTGHTGGVLSLSWCPMDSNLLMSCGRDGRTVCWNPNTGDILQELPQQGNWVFDVQWSPLVPTLVATSSFDHNFSVFSVQGSGSAGTASSQAGTEATPSGTAPKWLKRPCGATFTFGGRLVGFSSERKEVLLQTAAYDAELVEKEIRVDTLLSAPPADLQKKCTALCKEYAEGTQFENEKMIWNVLSTLNTPTGRQDLTALLGYNIEATKKMVAEFIANPKGNLKSDDVDALIKRCILSGFLKEAAECCMAAERYADALDIATLGDPQLQVDIKRRYAATRKETAYMRVVGALQDSDLGKFAASESLEQTSWQQLLICTLAYCDQQTLVETCAALANRLEEKGPETNNLGAQICHISAAKFDDVIRLWARDYDAVVAEAGNAVPKTSLQSFVHKVSIFEATTHNRTTSKEYSSKTTQYSEILASLGMVEAALRYIRRTALETEVSHNASVLFDRLYNNARPGGSPAPFPFTRNGVPMASTPRDEFLAPTPQSVTRQQPTPPTLVPRVDPGTTPPLGGQTSITQPQLVAPRQPTPPLMQPAALTQPRYVDPGSTPALGSKAPINQPIGAPVVVPPVVPTQPTEAALPQSTQQRTAPVVAPPVTTAASAGGGDACLMTSVDHVPPEQMEIVSLLRTAVQQVGDKRKRDSIDKALVVLFQSLNQRTLPPPVVQMLQRFARCVGTPEAKDIVKTLGTDHWDSFKPYMNIKFL